MDGVTDAPLVTGEAADFVAKWRAAWPEWSLAEGFVPAAHRTLADAWHALQFEWQEATWRVDARPGDLKLQWWMDELEGWSQGRRRHPLGSVLQRRPAPWSELAVALPTLAAARTRPAHVDAAWSSVAPVSEAAARVEAALFDSAGDARAVAATWLHARLARHPADAVGIDVPMSDEAAAGRAWARALLRDWPGGQGLPAARGVPLALARARLSRGNASAPLSPWATVWAAWRGARG